MMRGLGFVLQAKIALTVLAWCVPLLLFPSSALQRLGFPVLEPQLFLRLLGMAYSALVLGYGFGLQQLRAGTYPATTVWVGILSNGGACALLLIYAAQGSWSSWGPLAQLFMWSSLAGTAAITGGLVAFGPCSSHARNPHTAQQSPAT